MNLTSTKVWPLAVAFVAWLAIPSAADIARKGFSTPSAAADALIAAAGNFDVAALETILGPQSEDIVATKDPVQDKLRAQKFAAEARKKRSVGIDKRNPKRAILYVGDARWPFPVPMELRGGKWYFDAKTGRDEILLRRIGANELDAITMCRGYVEAQKKYAEESPAHEYAQRIISTPGARDGLYWENADGTAGGPIGKGAAKAIAEGYQLGQQTPFHGYYFKILKGQGPAAPLGQVDFVVNGAMIGGFALVAVPAEYRVTGVKTFMVSHDGIVYEKDLGPDSLAIVQAMDRYNPDKTWRATDAGW